MATLKAARRLRSIFGEELPAWVLALPLAAAADAGLDLRAAAAAVEAAEAGAEKAPLLQPPLQLPLSRRHAQTATTGGMGATTTRQRRCPCRLP